jgi:WD40 repeat protein
LCCGGDDGKYVAVCLDETKRVAAEGDTDPDARLPLDLDPSSRTTARETSSTGSSFSSSRRPRGPLSSKSSKIGQEIVNCIELWSPGPIASEAAYKIPVAVLSNNDHSVFILDVAESGVLEQIDFPDNVNRALISPDGTLLVSICDDPYLYLHTRVKRKPHGKGHIPADEGYQWEGHGRLRLEGQKQSDKSNMRGSFAACFSNSGKYLAIATQYGVISIFDAETLMDEDVDSLLKVFTSSRPGQRPGAIRAMSFSPGPFDLLVWTESSERIAVADLRNMFLSRQVITIDSHAEGVERAVVISRPNDTVIDPRHRSFRAESPSNSTTPDYLGLDLERRQLRHLTREMLDRHQAPLTTEELEVLQAHRIARRQRDEANEARETSERASSSRMNLLRDIQTLTNTGGSRPAERRISTSNLPAALREFVNPERSAASFRSFINERNQDRERRSQAEQEPRRLNLIQLAAADSAIERESLGPSTPRNNNDAASALERLTLTPSRQPPSGTDSPNNPWAEIDALYRARFPLDPPLDRSTRLRIEIEDEDRRDFAHRLRQPWRPLDDLNQIGVDSRGGHSDVLRSMLRNGSFETMGCSWSQDGRIL